MWWCIVQNIGASPITTLEYKMTFNITDEHIKHTYYIEMMAEKYNLMFVNMSAKEYYKTQNRIDRMYKKLTMWGYIK